MSNQAIHIDIADKSSESLKPVLGLGEDYTEIIQQYTVNYRVDKFYIHVGEPKIEQGWLLHISIIPVQMVRLLKVLLPELLEAGLPFKLAKNKKENNKLNEGHYGNFKIGKIITVYLDNEQIIAPLIAKLTPLTDPFTGPQVLTDYKIINNLYYRYGRFIPLIGTDPFGNKLMLIRDHCENLLIDNYSSPSLLPTWEPNPFVSFVKEEAPPPHFYVIGNKYMPIKVLKADTKGNVWKAIYFTKFLLPKFCVIKQGRKGMFANTVGADARQSISWQNKVNRELEEVLPTPKIFDFIEEENQSFLVMEYIRGGRNAITDFFSAFNNRPWVLQSIDLKREVINYLLQIISNIRIIHEHGYIHRDITGTNFLKTKKGTLKLIDLELIYSARENQPNPPFGLGTYGFMSPEQEARETPTVQDDIYGIGALLLLIFTNGLLPNFLVEKDYTHLIRKIAFFIMDPPLENLILRCIAINPIHRPNINELHDELTRYKHSLPSQSVVSSLSIYPDSAELDRTIHQAINTLSGKFLVEEGLWYSGIENSFGPEVYPLGKKHIFGGLYRGIGGVIWLLSTLKEQGIDIANAQHNIEAGFQFLAKEIIPTLPNITPSYYYGKSGFAVLYAQAINTSLLEDTPFVRDIIHNCFDNLANSFDIIYGIAGQGIAALKCRGFIADDYLSQLLKRYKEILLENQEKDGSWIKLTDQNQKEKATGFGYGIAGIAYFLLKYGSTYNDPEAINSAERALRYLMRNVRNNNGRVEWYNSDKDKRISTWWCNGSPGITLAFLKAFELTKYPSYFAFVEKILHALPANLIYQNLSQCHGMSGLGEIYLEAYQITQVPEWKERAAWIANVIIHQQKHLSETAIYWLPEMKELATADMMIGNAGIIHFLARYNNLDKFHFPLL